MCIYSDKLNAIIYKVFFYVIWKTMFCDWDLSRVTTFLVLIFKNVCKYNDGLRLLQVYLLTPKGRTYTWLIGGLPLSLQNKACHRSHWNGKPNRKRFCYYWAVLSKKSDFEHAQNAQIKIALRICKYHPGLCSSFLYYVVSNDLLSGHRRSWSDWTDAQIPEEKFSHGAVLLI